VGLLALKGRVLRVGKLPFGTAVDLFVLAASSSVLHDLPVLPTLASSPADPRPSRPAVSPLLRCTHPLPPPCSPGLHAPEGPLQRQLGRLLEVGAKSWRIMSIVSLQVGGLPGLAGSLVAFGAPTCCRLSLSTRLSGSLLCVSCCCTARALHCPKADQPPWCPVPLPSNKASLLVLYYSAPICPFLLQLCGLLAQHPEVAAHYSGHLRQLLLWGSSDDPGQSGVVRGSWACVERMA